MRVDEPAPECVDELEVPLAMSQGRGDSLGRRPSTARWLVTTTSGDFEQFVRELGRPAPEPVLPAPAGPPTAEQAGALAALAERYEIELVGPPLA